MGTKQKAKVWGVLLLLSIGKNFCVCVCVCVSTAGQRWAGRRTLRKSRSANW